MQRLYITRICGWIKKMPKQEQTDMIKNLILSDERLMLLLFLDYKMKMAESEEDFMTNGDMIRALLNPRDDQIKVLSEWIEIEIQRQGINFSCELKWWNSPYQPVKEAGIYDTTQELCEDTVSRRAVDKLSKELVHTTRDKADFLCNFWEGLQKLPPVTPQPKIGHWIRVDKDKLKCSECDVIHFIAQYPHGKIAWCPNCGAKMVEA